jgi:CBS domain-containing protein
MTAAPVARVAPRNGAGTQTVGPMLIDDVALVPAVGVSPRSSLRDAARILAATGVGTLLVDTEPVSEITEQNIVRAAASGAADEIALADLGRDAPDFVRPDTAVEHATSVMLAGGRRSLIVVDEGRAVGVLTLAAAIGSLGGPSWLGALPIARVSQVEP